MPDWLLELFSKADGDLMSGGYHAISVDPERVRRQLRTAGRPFVQPGGAAPPLDELDASARWVVEQARLKATALSGFAGLAGAPSIPPEIAARGIATVRLAQRLAIVYGFEPHTDRGRTALWRALAAGLEVELPEQGPVGLRVSDVPTMLSPRVSPRSVGVALAQALVYKSALYVAGRFGRFIPVVSGGVAAASANRDTEAIAERMIAVLRRLSEPGAMAVFAEAVEV
ncbi:MAG: hypothetical protein H6737_27380 [Alphaproteobacteria bacterium]|nr:hypothetical protein [Alphaproteobacteria bacterium]